MMAAESNNLDVKPIYGWGWVIMNQPRFAVPEPFTMAVQSRDLEQIRRWTGTVTTDGHEFSGAQVELRQRHTTWTGAVNVVVSREGQGIVAAGYAELPVE